MLINAIEKKCMDLETSKTVESSYLPLQEREKVVRPPPQPPCPPGPPHRAAAAQEVSRVMIWGGQP